VSMQVPPSVKSVAQQAFNETDPNGDFKPCTLASEKGVTTVAFAKKESADRYRQLWQRRGVVTEAPYKGTVQAFDNDRKLRGTKHPRKPRLIPEDQKSRSGSKRPRTDKRRATARAATGAAAAGATTGAPSSASPPFGSINDGFSSPECRLNLDTDQFNGDRTAVSSGVLTYHNLDTSLGVVPHSDSPSSSAVPSVSGSDVGDSNLQHLNCPRLPHTSIAHGNVTLLSTVLLCWAHQYLCVLISVYCRWHTAFCRYRDSLGLTGTFGRYAM